MFAVLCKNKYTYLEYKYYSGVHRAKKIDKLGMHSSDTAQIFFEDVRIPEKNLIGDENMGFMYQMLQFQEERLFGMAAST